jgi:hypothetical protein
MLHPVLTLLVASSFQAGADFSVPAEIAQIVVEITLTMPATLEIGEVLTIRDVPFYYDDFTPAAVPVVPLVVTYDWRSPVIFDLP